ncbi:conserved hypothetical protein [uncultured Desulfatiglans sp.]|uniref:CRISPR-associated protein, Cse1 family n=1 Tax=Uncultured Desulfatiglans sp. TaxID=1748965 RepID=A0A653AAA4_UNCDX|nr:conserved hypothetical protein [uncultured Desulfatiglans sp.]
MNVLTDEVFKAATSEGSARLSLPGLLESLGQDRAASLGGIQRHQVDIFHIFLCYLAGSVLARASRDSPTQTAAFWREGLRSLVDKDDDCAWELVVEDPTKSAFMQPPVSKQRVFETDYKHKSDTLDALDVLQTAKNHDIKTARAHWGDEEAWVFALISHQNSSGFLGQGNYGIARMNGGFGSRVCVGWQENRRPGRRFQRDVRILMAHRKNLLKEPYPYIDRGLTCLWTEPWDGVESLPLSKLDPFFIEVARRVRLLDRNGPSVFSATSKTSRVSAKDSKGNIGDPWTPVKESDSSALTPSASGFTPELLRNLIFRDNYLLSPIQTPASDEGAGWFCASVLVRGQGTTDGFHEAAIRIPARARAFLFGGGKPIDQLAEWSKLGLDMAGDIRNRCLRPSLYSLMEGGPDKVDFGKREITAWVDSQARLFSRAWQPRYFKWLWSTLDAEDTVAALRPWLLELKHLSQALLEKAFRICPARSGRGYRAISRANAVFFGGLNKNFADYMEERK